MKKTFDLYEIQVPFKYNTIEECDQKIAGLIEFIRYHAKENRYFCQGVVASSEHKSDNILGVIKVPTGEKGRRKFKKFSKITY